MIIPGIREMPLAEQAAELVKWTPPTYWNDTVNPFREIGFGDNPSDEHLGDFFENKDVLDIGSGAEGIARRLFAIFGDSELSPRVVNLNPQLAKKQFQGIVFEKMKLDMQIRGEDIDGYLEHRGAPGRLVTDGVVQDLPFLDETFDIQVSSWAFPKCIYDCRENYSENEISADEHAKQGYREILRTQKTGGIALLAPIRLGSEIEATEAQLSDLSGAPNFTHEFVPTVGGSNVLNIRRVA